MYLRDPSMLSDRVFRRILPLKNQKFRIDSAARLCYNTYVRQEGDIRTRPKALLLRAHKEWLAILL